MSNDEHEIIDAEIVESDNLPVLSEASTRSSMNNGTTAVPRWSEEYWRRARPEVQARRCVAHKSNGDRCLKAAINGATVCRTHGGATKHVKRAARARLENAADLMARQLLGIAIGGESETVRLQAIRDALDRAGVSKPTEVVLSQGEPKPWEEVYESIAGGSRAESRAARGVPDSDSTLPAFDAAEEPNVSTSFAYPVDGGSAEYNPESPPAPAAQSHSQSGPPRQPRPRRFDGQGHAEPARHITGDAAFEVSGQLHRDQLAIESPHKKYLRP